jgi:hypothetical protein
VSLPLYVGETRYYRRILHISWEYGSKLRRTGILRPDAQLEDGRVLYLLSPETLAQNEAAIASGIGIEIVDNSGAHVSIPLHLQTRYRGPFCRGLPPIRASAFDILKLAGSSSRLPGPLPRRRFPRTIFFERCFKGSFVCPVLCVSIFEKICKIPPVGSGSRHLVTLLIDYVLCLVPIRVRTRVPIIFFFSAACTEKLRETTTNAAMTPTTPLLSCVMGLSSNLIPCECGCEIGRGSLDQRLPYRLHPFCPPLR